MVGVVLDFDERKRVVGIEIEDGNRFARSSRLEAFALPVINLILGDEEPTCGLSLSLGNEQSVVPWE
jgi:hypothetical protein